MRDSFPSMNYEVVEHDGNNFQQEKNHVCSLVSNVHNGKLFNFSASLMAPPCSQIDYRLRTLKARLQNHLSCYFKHESIKRNNGGQGVLLFQRRTRHWRHSDKQDKVVHSIPVSLHRRLQRSSWPFPFISQMVALTKNLFVFINYALQRNFQNEI